MVVRISISRNRRCSDEEDICHNRWHPDIKPAAEVEPGEEVVLETRDAFDGQITDAPSVDDVVRADLGVVHPLTGPIYVKGAEPGDVLAVHILDITPDEFGFTVNVPGFGFLRDVFRDPYKIRWRISGFYAESPDLPNVRVPGAPFMGTIGVAPSRELLTKWRSREDEVAKKGGYVLPPDPRGAVPRREPIASEGLRTIPPRENGGNLDIKDLAPGSILYLPVFVKGALFSAGDAHFAQGNGEVCGTAIEMRASLRVKFEVVKDGMRRLGVTRPVFKPSPLVERFRNYFCLGGFNFHNAEDATQAARDAVLNMVSVLEGVGLNRYQAYLLFSVVGDLKLSQVVDVPNYTVSSCLPLDVFTKPIQLPV
ncbi:acetamidase/formamidase family protein [Pyrobaculum ferrireducens]|uniref:Acetamidase/formamidase n=1 Tax=Pyrobaculum ferrireducens TaxID=1104324 RepID=G7VE40_9CREN|nr:acetamidase/formamidase family protein [Pyrobaculum ferrireducens]AET32813.1 acetamidase/formamidase [Pyrobaculum ferrireducens]